MFWITRRRKEIAAMKDEDIDYSDIPELDADFWENAIVKRPESESYQVKMNAVLRSFFESPKNPR